MVPIILICSGCRPNSERKFPDMISFRDDINMWVLTKTLPRRQTQKISAYFIFTKQRLSTGLHSLSIISFILLVTLYPF